MRKQSKNISFSSLSQVFDASSTETRVRKKGVLEKGSFQKSRVLEILENLEILEILEIVESEGESDHFLEILENLEIVEILENGGFLSLSVQSQQKCTVLIPVSAPEKRFLRFRIQLVESGVVPANHTKDSQGRELQRRSSEPGSRTSFSSQDDEKKRVEVKGAISRDDRNRQNRQNRHGLFLALYFAGQANLKEGKVLSRTAKTVKATKTVMNLDGGNSSGPIEVNRCLAAKITPR